MAFFGIFALLFFRLFSLPNRPIADSAAQLTHCDHAVTKKGAKKRRRKKSEQVNVHLCQEVNASRHKQLYFSAIAMPPISPQRLSSLIMAKTCSKHKPSIRAYAHVQVRTHAVSPLFANPSHMHATLYSKISL